MERGWRWRGGGSHIEIRSRPETDDGDAPAGSWGWMTTPSLLPVFLLPYASPTEGLMTDWSMTMITTKMRTTTTTMTTMTMTTMTMMMMTTMTTRTPVLARRHEDHALDMDAEAHMELILRQMAEGELGELGADLFTCGTATMTLGIRWGQRGRGLIVVGCYCYRGR